MTITHGINTQGGSRSSLMRRSSGPVNFLDNLESQIGCAVDFLKDLLILNLTSPCHEDRECKGDPCHAPVNQYFFTNRTINLLRTI